MKVTQLLKPNGQIFTLNENELNFIDAVIRALKEENLPSDFALTWKSGDVIDFKFPLNDSIGMQFGRIKLRGKVFKMQILYGDTVEWLDNISFETAISNIHKWVDYVKQLKLPLR